MLKLDDSPTAIFAGSDMQAMGVYNAARLRRLRIPDDLSVVGFDDLPMSGWVSPPLTTIIQPARPDGGHGHAHDPRAARRPHRHLEQPGRADHVAGHPGQHGSATEKNGRPEGCERRAKYETKGRRPGAAWNTVARFDDHSSAQRAVDRLSDHG